MSFRVYRSIRRLRRLVNITEGGIQPAELLFLGRTLGGMAAMRAIMILLIPLIVAEIRADIEQRITGVSPRRRQLRDLYGDEEGDARWQKENIEREIRIDLSGETA